MESTRRGLLEAGLWLAAAVALAAVIGAGWTLLAGGSYVNRLGWACAGLGLVATICSPGLLTRVGGADGFAMVGKGPEMGLGDVGRGRYLTSTGFTLFVGVPLLVVGGLLIG